MIQAAKQFSAGIFTLHPLWQAWVLGMVIINGVIPLFFITKLAALVTLSGVLSAAILAIFLVRLHGFSKLIGLMHMPWVPMLVAQIGLYPGFNIASPYSLWLTASITVSSIALVIDALDVTTYLRLLKADQSLSDA